MCSACEDFPLEQLALDDPVVLQAREIERGMNGDRVPESAWRVYLCISDEPISWEHYERVRSAIDEAKALPIRTLKARRMRQPPACKSVS
jgi:hypothetical protein